MSSNLMHSTLIKRAWVRLHRVYQKVGSIPTRWSRSGEKRGRFDSYKALVSKMTKGLRVCHLAVMTFARRENPHSLNTMRATA